MDIMCGAVICILYLTWGGLYRSATRSAFLLIAVISVISTLRVYAINPRDWIAPSVTFVLFLVPVATNLVRAAIHGTPQYYPVYDRLWKAIFLAPKCAHGLESPASFLYLHRYKQYARAGTEYVSAPGSCSPHLSAVELRALVVSSAFPIEHVPHKCDDSSSS